MKVKVLRCYDPMLWYYDSIGESYSVYGFDTITNEYVVRDSEGLLNIIKDKDCEVVQMISEVDIKDFEDYQEKAWEFAASTAKNPPYLFGNLGGEAGEVLSVWAKSVRDGTPPEDFYEKIVKELGDVLWMVSGIATYYGMSLHDIAKMNIDKLNQREQRGTIHGSGDNR